MPVCTPGQQKSATVALTVGVTWLMSVKAGPKCGHDLRSGTNPASLADLLLVLTDLLAVPDETATRRALAEPQPLRDGEAKGRAHAAGRSTRTSGAAPALPAALPESSLSLQIDRIRPARRFAVQSLGTVIRGTPYVYVLLVDYWLSDPRAHH